MNNDLKKLPPPPQGQKGLTFDELNSLPPPPKGQVGLTFDQVMQASKPSLEKKAISAFSDYSRNVATGISDPLINAGQQVYKDITADQNMFQRGYNVAGSIAGGVARSVGGAINEGIIKPLVGLNSRNPVVTTLANSDAGGKVLDTVNSGMGSTGNFLVDKWNQFKAGNPDAARNIENAGNIFEFMSLVVPENKAIQTKAGNVIDDTARGVKETFASGKQKAPNMAQNKATLPSDKSLTEAVEVTKPVLNKKGAIASFEKAGQPGGVNKSYQYVPNEKDLEVARSVQGVVSKNNGPVDNIVNVNKEISRVSEAEVAPYLKDNPKPFNFEDLRGYVEKTKPASTLADNPEAFATYNRVREKVLNRVYNHLKSEAKKTGNYGNQTDLNQLWDARKIVDDVIQEELGVTTFDSPQYSGVKGAAIDMRNQLNNFINDSLSYEGQMSQVNKMLDFINEARARGIDVNDPAVILQIQDQFGITRTSNEANKAFTEKLNRMSNMYEARTNIAEQNYKLMDKNAFQRWVKQNPGKWKAIKNGGLYFGLPALGFEILKE